MWKFPNKLTYGFFLLLKKNVVIGVLFLSVWFKLRRISDIILLAVQSAEGFSEVDQ